MKDLKEYLMFNEASTLSNIDNTLISEEEMRSNPEQVLNNKYKDFKELIEALAKYFGVKVPDIVRKEETSVQLDGGFQIRRYYDVDEATFDLKNSNTDTNKLRVIDNKEGNYPVFVVYTDFMNGKLRRMPLAYTYGEVLKGFIDTRVKPYKYKKDKFYDWCPNEFKEWLKSN